MVQQQQVSLRQASFICGLASLFYLYDFFVRVMPATMTDDLMSIYQIDATGLGLLSSLFFYAYLIMQIPCGLLYDRYGPRKVITITTFITAIATFVFMFSSLFSIGASARFVMGLGAAFAYVGPLVLASRWFPPKYFALIVGIIQLMGSIGAIAGESFLSWFIDQVGVTYSVFYISIIGLVLAMLLWTFVKDFPPGFKKRTSHISKTVTEWIRIRRVAKKPQTWCVGLYAFTCWAPISVFAALWGIEFLQAADNITKSHAATLLASVWVGVALGGPILGWLSGQITSRKIPLIIAGVFGVISSSAIVYYISAMPNWLTIILLFIMGTASSGQAVTFGVVQDNNHPKVVGTAVGFNNMAILIGGALLQPFVGYILDLVTDHDSTVVAATHSGMSYTLNDFQQALFVLPLCYLIALLTALFLVKETRCRANYQKL